MRLTTAAGFDIVGGLAALDLEAFTCGPEITSSTISVVFNEGPSLACMGSSTPSNHTFLPLSVLRVAQSALTAANASHTLTTLCSRCLSSSSSESWSSSW